MAASGPHDVFAPARDTGHVIEPATEARRFPPRQSTATSKRRSNASPMSAFKKQFLAVVSATDHMVARPVIFNTPLAGHERGKPSAGRAVNIEASAWGRSNYLYLGEEAVGRRGLKRVRLQAAKPPQIFRTFKDGTMLFSNLRFSLSCCCLRIDHSLFEFCREGSMGSHLFPHTRHGGTEWRMNDVAGGTRPRRPQQGRAQPPGKPQ